MRERLWLKHEIEKLECDIDFYERQLPKIKKELAEKKALFKFITSEETPDTIGDRLKKERLLKEMSVFKLSCKADVSPNHITRTEDNDLEGIPSESWEKLATALGLRLDYLLYGTGKPYEKAVTEASDNNASANNESTATDTSSDTSDTESPVEEPAEGEKKCESRTTKTSKKPL